jgi:hypothetical protein
MDETLLKQCESTFRLADWSLGSGQYILAVTLDETTTVNLHMGDTDQHSLARDEALWDKERSR